MRTHLPHLTISPPLSLLSTTAPTALSLPPINSASQCRPSLPPLTGATHNRHLIDSTSAVPLPS
ncbi:hypothetical protein BVRB_2g030500 [Beta vulgaris subsp. vulgaris]|nr:hypothetical protein BVRB_2g030500 [Beta vulgaris subsp. vulgaris]